MAIIDRHIAPLGLSRRSLNVIDFFAVGLHKASTITAVRTTQTFSSTFNSTLSVAGNIDFPRNLVYQLSLTNGTASSNMISGGTVQVSGFDIQGSAIFETIALTALASASVPVAGAAIFGSILSNGISLSNVSLATASSSASNSVSFSIGVGNIVGLPFSIGSAYTATLPNGAPALMPYAWLGTAIQNGSYTVQVGDVGTAGVSFSNALASGSQINLALKFNGVSSGGSL